MIDVTIPHTVQVFFPSYRCRDSSSAAHFAATSTNVSSGDSACWARRTATDARRAASSDASPRGCPWTVSTSSPSARLPALPVYNEQIIYCTIALITMLNYWVTMSTHLLRAYFTACQQSCRKVVFSAVSVCSGGKGTSCAAIHDVLGALQYKEPPSSAPSPLDMGPHCTGTRPDPAPRLAHLKTLGPQCWYLVATEKHTYGQQVDGMHPTEMFSCWCLNLFIVSANQCNKDNAEKWLWGLMVKI